MNEKVPVRDIQDAASWQLWGISDDLAGRAAVRQPSWAAREGLVLLTWHGMDGPAQEQRKQPRGKPGWTLCEREYKLGSMARSSVSWHFQSLLLPLTLRASVFPISSGPPAAKRDRRLALRRLGKFKNTNAHKAIFAELAGPCVDPREEIENARGRRRIDRG